MQRTETIIAFLVLIPIVIWFGILLRRAVRNARRRRMMNRPFPSEWETILLRHLPLYQRLPKDLKRQLQGAIHVFLAEKTFEGCGGLTITDDIRVTIAAEACMLLLSRPSTYYPNLSSIVVYPHAYTAGAQGSLGNQFDAPSVRLGESWLSGTLVLSWDDVKSGARNWHDGHNVVMHEFAHQLDQEDGASDGAPILSVWTRYAAWASILGHDYQTLCRRVRQGKKTVLDRYGATNAAEFFAVATEAFFEKPRQLSKKHPELYEELRDYYSVDPLAWN